MANKLNYPRKNKGNQFTSTNANEVLDVVNSHADRIDALTGSLYDGIAYNAVAPTPGKSCEVEFISAGVTGSWLGGITVKVGDRVIVKFTAPSTYEYKAVIIDNSQLPEYNVTVNVPLSAGQYYTATTARAAVPTANKKLGLKITYATASEVWVTEQFIGSSISNWMTESNWLLDVKITQTLSGNETNKTASVNLINKEIARINYNFNDIIALSISDFDKIGIMNRTTGIVDSAYTGYKSIYKYPFSENMELKVNGLWSGNESVHSSIIFHSDSGVISFYNVGSGTYQAPEGVKFVSFSTDQTKCSIKIRLKSTIVLKQKFKSIKKSSSDVVGILSSTGVLTSSYTNFYTSPKIYVYGDEYIAYTTTPTNSEVYLQGYARGIVLFDKDDNLIEGRCGNGLLKLNSFVNVDYFRICRHINDLYFEAKIIRAENIFSKDVYSDVVNQMIDGDTFLKHTYSSNYIDGKGRANGSHSFSNGATIIADFHIPTAADLWYTTIYLSELPNNTNTQSSVANYRSKLFEVGQLIGVGSMSKCDVYYIKAIDVANKILGVNLVHDNLNLTNTTFKATTALNSGNYQTKIFLLQDALIFNAGGIPYSATYDTVHPIDSYYNKLADAIIARIKEKNYGTYPTYITMFGDSFLHYLQIKNRINSVTGITLDNWAYGGWDVESIVQEFVNSIPNINRLYVFVFGTNSISSLSDTTLHTIQRNGYKQVLSEQIARIASYLPNGNFLILTGHCRSNKILVETDLIV